jgi:4-hydroxythreonine-4-phosphate dehydrogenase
MATLPVIGITMGDPAGIGPEIIAKAFAAPEVRAECRPLVIGDPDIIAMAVGLVGAPLTVNAVDGPEAAIFAPGVIDVLPIGDFDAAGLRRGKVDARCGKLSYDCVVKAIELAMAGRIDATVTNPINKEAIAGAGLKQFAGHTEIYAHHTATKRYTMMLAEDTFRVVHVSTHVSLREACDRVKQARVAEVIDLAQAACVDLGIAKPRIAVAGLNPHAGENGLFGREEIDEIMPAIRDARARGLDVDGPVPPDTVFSKMHGRLYDITVCMYHDQGHIPTKLLGFRYDPAKGEWETVAGVNITLGLPIIRTSVDHGTAFDLAGSGRASADSLKNAIAYAAALAKGRIARQGRA